MDHLIGKVYTYNEIRSLITKKIGAESRRGVKVLVDVDQLINYYDRLIEIVQQTASDADAALKALNGTVVADEIALDFSERYDLC